MIFARVFGIPYKINLHPERVERATSGEQVDPEHNEVDDHEGDGCVHGVQEANRDGPLRESAVEEQNRDLCCRCRDHVERLKCNGDLHVVRGGKDIMNDDATFRLFTTVASVLSQTW
jgi:hypothetical protein